MLFGTPNTPVQPQQTTPSGAVIDVTTETFETAVLHASMDKPVIVQFWAQGCAPCAQLSPLLEQAVAATGGIVSLTKVNISENTELAGALRIQSVPTVYAFFGGRPVDAFQGALPQSQIKAFIDKLVQTAKQAQPGALDIPESLKAAALALSEEDINAAHALYVQILQQDEKNAQAYAGLIRVFLAAGQIEQAAQLIETVPDDIAKDSHFAAAKTALELAQIKPGSSSDSLREKIEKNPKDHQARLDLALAQFSAGDKEDAINTLIESITLDRTWNEAAARHQLLKFFEALGHSDPLTVQGRKKLSTLLFS